MPAGALQGISQAMPKPQRQETETTTLRLCLSVAADE